MAKKKTEVSPRKRTLKAQCDNCEVYDEWEGRMVHHMGRQTDWLPGPGYDPNIRQFKCVGCGLLFYKRCTTEELIDE
jgi:hypothetical protein